VVEIASVPVSCPLKVTSPVPLAPVSVIGSQTLIFAETSFGFSNSAVYNMQLRIDIVIIKTSISSVGTSCAIN